MRVPARVVVPILLCLAHAIFLESPSAQVDHTFGTWSTGQPAPGNFLATHPTLLRNNKILVVGGSSYNCCFTWGKEEARLYDIASGTWSAPLPSPAPYGADKDAFCAGHAHDHTGGVIFQGGLHSYVHNGSGIPDSARYDVASGAFSQISGAAPHWYPTLVAGERHMFNFPGHGTEPPVVKPTGVGDRIHKLPYGQSSWAATNVSLVTKSTYPRVVLLPSGKFFVASPAADRMNYLYDPKTDTVSSGGTDQVPDSDPALIHGGPSWKGSGVLLPLVPTQNSYPHPRFALVNGISAWVKDLGVPAPVWQSLGARPPPLSGLERVYANATLLPTGQVFVSGGVQSPLELDSGAVFDAEVYDPDANAWLMTSAASVPRNYHGVAVLLPDGRVWTASGSQEHEGSQCGAPEQPCNPGGPERTEERVEIFTPWYVGRRDRPIITTAPATIISDGRAFDVGIGNAPGSSIERVVLMRPGSPTHSFDANQRLVQLEIVARTAGTVTVKGPYVPAAAPPGDYMLFALRSVAPEGFKRLVPSVAAWTRVSNTIRTDTGAPIWRYTGLPCSGASCPGWQRLDNNPKTMAVFASRLHHQHYLYQLHNDGEVWQFTGTACVDDWCPGWQRLDNNHRTVMLAPAGNRLYQLQNDGSIWRYTGTPCKDDVCVGWERLDNNSKALTIAASADDLYQQHNDGSIWRYTGTPCKGDVCTGWERLDNNHRTVMLAAGGDNLLCQLQDDGSIWQYTGTPCAGEKCPSWRRLDANRKTVAIAAGGHRVYQLQNDGWVWQYTGTPCTGESCPGWQRLDNNSRTTALAAGGGGVFQRHFDGRVFRYLGAPCNGDSCQGWEQVDRNPRTGLIATAETHSMSGGDPLFQLHTDPVYQLHKDGWIWRYTGTECDKAFCPGWQRLDNNPNSVEIAASGSHLFQRHRNGQIWRFIGTPCNGDSCQGWQQIDDNPRSAAIVAAGTQLYQRHDTGEIWRYLGWPCGGGACQGWQRLDRNPGTIAIAATATSLFQLRNDGRIWRYTGTPCTGDTCPGWQLLDDNPTTAAIVTAANQLFQLHKSGSVWRHTGIPCAGATCQGWQQLDNNPATAALAGGGNQLYQRQSNGEIWRFTGVPCNGAKCQGWERLDNNPAAVEIVAAPGALYQRHKDGRIWKFVGPACSGETCQGWRELDNNAQAIRIAAGGFQ
jgi:hypothetical protein